MQILAMLQGVSGPNASGEYSARCPAHDDKTASLTVRSKRSGRDGKEKIFLCCHAGCPTDAILAELGLRTRDLIVDPDRPEAKGQRGKPKQQPKPEQVPGLPGVDVYPARPEPPKQDAPKRLPFDISKPTRVYSYTDADGREVFQVCRYEYQENGKREKTFRQRRHDPADPKANRAGFVYSVPNEIRDATLYRMPQLLRAMAEHRPVYVVEGEKDVETLERLGQAATCNPGGASKWRDSYSRILTGADVIILPDNDSKGNGYAGQNHALSVALSLQGTAARVRLVNLAEACPELPPKGDISDMVQLMGDVEAMDALARQVAATRDFDPQDVPFWLSPVEQAERLYAMVPGFGVLGGNIVQGDPAQPAGCKALTDFVVIPRMELIRDDGVTASLHFVLDGWTGKGQKLGRVTIKASDMDSMNWVTEQWGFRASMAPGSTTKSKVAWCVKKVGQMTARRVTEYTHTGWRKIGGKWAFLYHGGAIGMEGVTVDMGDALKQYRLDGGAAPGFDQITYQEAAAASLKVQRIMNEDIGIALLGTVYLAPLREFLSQTDIVPAFALFLYGESGTHKTTAAALALSHFGNFHAKNPPASFSDTGNQIRKKAFLLKDVPILVDDFHPASSLQEKKTMAATAQALSRAFGDGVDRGRLNADSTVKAATPPRSVAIITGEDLPAIGASGLARYFILDIDKGDIPVGKELTEMQELARRGTLQRAMRGYILWLLQQTEELPGRLHDQFLQYREQVQRMTAEDRHDRAPETVACILTGYAMMLNYFRDVGAIETEEAKALLVHAMERLVETSSKQTAETRSERPTRIFLDSLSELLANKQAVLKDLTLVEDKALPPQERMIGYMDGSFVYLLPGVAYGLVQRLCHEQGVEFPVSLRALYKTLRADGVIAGAGTETKRIGDRVLRVLRISRRLIEAPEAAQQQESFTEVGNEGLPAEWT